MGSIELSMVLNSLGLRRGQTVFMHSSIHKFRRAAYELGVEQLCPHIVDSIISVIGSTGTLVVPTFTTDCGKYGAPFDRDTTACDSGVLPEFLRQKSGAIRSLHPVNSIAAYGYKAYEYTHDIALGSYCLESPFARMAQDDTLVLRMGASHNLSNSFAHYLEAHYNVPYLYNKTLDYISVTVSGIPIHLPFYMSVNYLKFNISSDRSAHDELLQNAAAMTFGQWGGSVLHAIPLRDYVKIIGNAIKKNPYFLLKNHPDFIQGIIPCEGKPIPQ